MLRGGQTGGHGGDGDDHRKPRDKLPSQQDADGPFYEIVTLLIAETNVGDMPSMLNKKKTDLTDEGTATIRTRSWLQGLVNCPHSVQIRRFSHLAQALHHVLVAAQEAGLFETVVKKVTSFLMAKAEADLNEDDE